MATRKGRNTRVAEPAATPADRRTPRRWVRSPHWPLLDELASEREEPMLAGDLVTELIDNHVASELRKRFE